ncbi:MAG: hypothetical protein ACYDC6_08120 [Acidobacteriaceae bacterium]
MKTVGHFGLMLALLMSLVAPTMACSIPGAHLTVSERACCVQMKSQCGSMTMPASHDCCHIEVPTSGHSNVAYIKSVNPQITVATVFAFPPAISLSVPVTLSDTPEWNYSVLPQSPPRTVSVLRI